VACDLDAITAANTVAITSQADVVVANDSSGLLQDFRAIADGSAAGTNISAEKVLCFGAVKALLDARSFYIWQQKGNRAAGLRKFQEKQGDLYARRTAFETLWEGGESFRYLALNAGGLGTQDDFGKFCLITIRLTENGRAAAVFPGDSVQRYTTATGVDEELVRREAAAWAVRGAVAVIERRAEALAADPADWPVVICRPGNYLEVVIASSLPLSDLAEVRLPASYLDTLKSYDRDESARKRLTQEQNNELAAFRLLHRWRRTYGIAITPLP
jgi:hypothetical protein